MANNYEDDEDDGIELTGWEVDDSDGPLCSGSKTKFTTLPEVLFSYSTGKKVERSQDEKRKQGRKQNTTNRKYEEVVNERGQKYKPTVDQDKKQHHVKGRCATITLCNDEDHSSQSSNQSQSMPANSVTNSPSIISEPHNVVTSYDYHQHYDRQLERTHERRCNLSESHAIVSSPNHHQDNESRIENVLERRQLIPVACKIVGLMLENDDDSKDPTDIAPLSKLIDGNVQAKPSLSLPCLSNKGGLHTTKVKDPTLLSSESRLDAPLIPSYSSTICKMDRILPVAMRHYDKPQREQHEQASVNRDRSSHFRTAKYETWKSSKHTANTSELARSSAKRAPKKQGTSILKHRNTMNAPRRDPIDIHSDIGDDEFIFQNEEGSIMGDAEFSERNSMNLIHVLSKFGVNYNF